MSKASCYFGIAAVALTGAVCLTVAAVWGSHRIDAETQRIVAPGEGTIRLPEAGTYTVFYEELSVLDGVAYRGPEHLDGLEWLATPIDGSLRIRATPAASAARAEGPGYAGTAILEFDVDSPGEYRFSAHYVSGALRPRVVLAIRFNYVHRVATLIAASFAMAGCATLICVAIVVRYRRGMRASTHEEESRSSVEDRPPIITS